MSFSVVSDDIRPDVSEILEMKEMPKVQLLSGQEQNCPEAHKKYPKKENVQHREMKTAKKSTQCV